jgi:hypothetical protein
MGKESIQSAPAVAADHGRDAAQLKAEHGKEMSALKAEEAQALAAQKAEHSKTPGKTGLIAKLTGKEDPVKKAEQQQLKAEIARAEETTKAAHDHENAELKAHGSKHMASANAVDSLHGSNHAGALPVAGGLAHGAHGSTTDSHVLDAGIPDKKIYNHATGAHGQAALADNGVHHHNHQHGIAAFADNGLGDRHHHDNNNQGQAGFNQGQAGYNQGGLMQGGLVQGGVIPVAMMPVAQAAVPVAMAAAPMATHGAPLVSAPLATHGAPLAATTHGAPLATNGGSHMAGGTAPVAVIAPSHSNRL